MMRILPLTPQGSEAYLYARPLSSEQVQKDRGIFPAWDRPRREPSRKATSSTLPRRSAPHATSGSWLEASMDRL